MDIVCFNLDVLRARILAFPAKFGFEFASECRYSRSFAVETDILL